MSMWTQTLTRQRKLGPCRKHPFSPRWPRKSSHYQAWQPSTCCGLAPVTSPWIACLVTLVPGAMCQPLRACLAPPDVAQKAMMAIPGGLPALVCVCLTFWHACKCLCTSGVSSQALCQHRTQPYQPQLCCCCIAVIMRDTLGVATNTADCFQDQSYCLVVMVLGKDQLSSTLETSQIATPSC